MSQKSAAAVQGAAGMRASRQMHRLLKQEKHIHGAECSDEAVKEVLKTAITVEHMVGELLDKNDDEEEEDVVPTIVDSKAFQSFIYGTILLNTITMGLQADLNSDAWQATWLVFENIFTAVFAGEMVFKILILKFGYFWNVKQNSPMYWNLLDFVISWLAIVDCWILTFVQNSDTPLIRVMQLLRILRILKLLRLRQELVAIIEGLFSSLHCMVWIGFLLLIVIYAFGILCRNIMGNMENRDFEDKIDNEMYFGTLPRAMLTLFNICLIDSWGVVIWPQMLYNQWMVLPLILFMCICCFGLINALIGVIVERTTAAQRNVSRLQEEADREKKMYMVVQLLEAIDSSDADGSGTINLAEFKQVQKNAYAQQIFSALNLPPGFKAEDLFQLLDTDGDGVLDRYEFLLGICRLIWCDEFQSQCLLNFTLSQVREDIRALQISVQDLKAQAPADALKSMAASIRQEFQEALDSSLERYFGGSAASSVPVRREEVHGAVPAADVPPATEVRPLVRPDQVAVQVAEVAEFGIQLPSEMIEAVEQLLEQLATVSGALRLSLRSDGLLLGEACEDSQERLQQILQELADTGESEMLQGFPTGDEAWPTELGGDKGSKRRKYRRAKKAKAPDDGD